MESDGFKLRTKIISCGSLHLWGDARNVMSYSSLLRYTDNIPSYFVHTKQMKEEIMLKKYTTGQFNRPFKIFIE